MINTRKVSAAPPSRQRWIVVFFCLAAGGITEGLQSLTGRDASFGDILRDLLGGMITLTWFHPSSSELSREALRAMRVLMASFLFAAVVPLSIALCDEWIARAQFPLLSDFETPFEGSRWYRNDSTAVDRSVARHGKASLRVEMDTSPYSGASLVYFPGDWTGYGFLRFAVFNPSPEEMKITCRIHDRKHEAGEQRYEDRFNKRIILRKGWNDLRIDLGEVARAPAGRSMNLGEICLVGLVAVNLPEARTIYVDDVRLEN